MQMPTKSRGKSAAIVVSSSGSNTDLNAKLLNVNADITSSSSPLKIESVIPGRSRNLNNRSIHRSYSTLSINYLKKLITDNNNNNHKQPNCDNLDHRLLPQPHMKHEANADGNSKNGEIGTLFSSTTVTTPSSNGRVGNSTIHHGFWRIQRTIREKEKFPDRINLDRRGLTTLPIIADEPNLRLLSLQHNLINSFCVPAGFINDVDLDNEGAFAVDSGVAVNEKIDVVKKCENSDIVGGGGQGRRLNNTIKSSMSKQQTNNGKRLVRTQSIVQPKPSSSSSSSVSRNFFMHNNGSGANSWAKNIRAGCGDGANGTDLQESNSSGTRKRATITRENSSSTGKSSLAPKSALLHAKEKYVLRKSNSFINSYSRHLVATKAHLGRLIQNRANGKSGLGTIGPMSSFSSDSTLDVELRPPVEMLIVKNDPFSGFACSLQNLVFLDLYDNQIERISNLDGLRSLTVLLLGKNRISDISGIVSVKSTLRVLDLHGNKISSISQRICQLQELKSLNLAGNSLKQIQADDFKGLTQLKELNLKRNKIKKINGFDDQRSLERLWLCHNDLQRVEDMASIAKAINLREVTVENNPVSLAGDCVSFLVSYLPNLVLLSQMHVTEQVRRAAMSWRKSKELADANCSYLNSDVCHTIRREEVISNARTNWELLRSQQPIMMSKGANYIQKTINRVSKQLQFVAGTSDQGVDVHTNLSENVIIDRKLIRQKTQMIRKNLRKPMTAKMKRCVSQENNSTGASEMPEFRLPPILPLFNDSGTAEPAIHLSTSSVGANIDSTSSHFSSDNEEQTQKIGEGSFLEKNKIITVENFTTKIDPDPEPIPSYNEKIDTNSDQDDIKTDQGEMEEEEDEKDSAKLLPQNCLYLDENSDKISNLSDCSAKTPSEGTASTTFVAIAAEKATQKARNAIQTKRSCQHPLQRAQTAKIITPYTPQPINSNAQTPSKPPKIIPVDREREQGGDYLIEICGRYLNVYGSGAIKFIDRQWNVQKANDVHTFKFSYVNFNSVAGIFGRIKTRFSNAENFAFRETNIQCLGQLNALAEIQGISSLTIDPDGNPICTKQWRSYAIYRLAHWGIKTINSIEITQSEVELAETTYSGLSDLVLWSLPESLVEPLLFRLHLEETCSTVNTKMTAKQWLMQADLSLRLVVGKEALQCKVPAGVGINSTTATISMLNMHNNENEFRLRGRKCLAHMMNNTYNAVDKLKKLETVWPDVLLNLIKNTLIDYAQMNAYVRTLMTDIGVDQSSPASGKH